MKYSKKYVDFIVEYFEPSDLYAIIKVYAGLYIEYEKIEFAEMVDMLLAKYCDSSH